jgi:hypothetical protein
MARGQILSFVNESDISEVALQCGDEYFNDFNKNIYKQAIYRAQRDIARQYNVLERIWSYTTVETDLTGSILIDVNNFDYEYKVVINDIEYTKVNQLLSEDNIVAALGVDDAEVLLASGATSISEQIQYTIRYETDGYYLNYNFRSIGDTIIIYYMTEIDGTQDYDEDEGDTIPVLPNKFKEEIIKRSVVYIAKLALARFIGEKAEKYGRVLRIYSNPRNQRDDTLERDRAWITIKPFQFP